MAGENSATQPGVQSRDGGYIDESPDRELTPREEALASIARQRHDALADEIVEGGGARPTFGAPDPDDIENNDDDARKPALLKPKAEPARKPAAAPDELSTDAQLERQGPSRFTGDVKNTLVTVTVDGEVMELPLDRVVANFQKGAAADKRLEEATRLRREAQERLDEAQGAGAPQASAPAPSPKPKTDFKAVSSAMFEGDEDTASAAFEAAVAERVQDQVKIALAAEGRGSNTPATQPTLDVATITASVKQQIIDETAWEASKARYPQMTADEDVWAVAHAKIKKRVDEGMAFTQALSEAEGQMAKSFGWKPAASSERTQTRPIDRTLIDERADRKKGIDSVPTASAQRGADAQDDEPIMDENLRASRGIAQLMKGRPGQQAE